MRARTIARLLFGCGMSLATGAVWAAGDGLLHPRIAQAGGIADIGVHPEADPGRTRRLLFDLDSEHGQGVHPGLDAVARVLNLLALSKVSDDHIDVVVLLRGGATPLALQPAAFARETGHAHADAALVNALLDAGVRIEVCGQALHRNGYAVEDVDPRITVVLAAVLRREALLADGFVLAR